MDIYSKERLTWAGLGGFPSNHWLDRKLATNKNKSQGHFLSDTVVARGMGPISNILSMCHQSIDETVFDKIHHYRQRNGS